MTAKHKPATALPKLPMRACMMEGGKRIALVNTHGGLVTYFDGNRAHAEAIVHAANAYPKLVEALKEYASAGTVGRDLLRELGESE